MSVKSDVSVFVKRVVAITFSPCARIVIARVGMSREPDKENA